MWLSFYYRTFYWMAGFSTALIAFALVTLHSSQYWLDYASTRFQNGPLHEYDFIIGTTSKFILSEMLYGWITL